MPKGMVPDREAATLAVELRDMLHRLEVGMADLKGQGEGVLELLLLRDRLEEQFARLREEGLDLRPERTRLETVDAIMTRKTAAVQRELKEMGGLAGARRKYNPPQEHWWWYLDLYLAEKQRKTMLRTGITVLAVVALVLIANLVLDRFFGLSPAEKAARNHEASAEQYIMRGDIDQAITEYEQAVQILPTSGEDQTMLGVLYEEKGRTEEAQKAFAAAQAIYPSRLGYLLYLTQSYETVGELDKALAAIQEAYALSPNSAQVYYERGSVYEAMNKVPEAIQDYEKAADLAQADGEDTLYVLAKTRLGMLLQRGPLLATPTPSS